MFMYCIPAISFYFIHVRCLHTHNIHQSKMSKKYSRDMNEDYIKMMEPKQGWKSELWQKFADFRKSNPHHLLVVSDTPCISASTTVTNFESVETLSIPVGSNNKRIGTLEENLKMAQSEIVPLQLMEKGGIVENGKGSINDAIGINIYMNTTEPKPKLFNQVLTSISVSLVSMVVGFVSAFTSPAAESLKHDLTISEEEISWIGGLMPLGALIGGLVGGQMIDHLGRKCTIFATNVMFIVSWICISVAVNVWYVYVGRAIAGFAVGITTLALPVYLGETIQPEVRGTLGLLPTGFGNTGILMCFIIGTYLPWDKLAWVGVAIPIPFIILAFIIPETPKWYISKSKYDNAKKALQWLRGKDTNVDYEFNNLARAQEKSTSEKTQSLAVLFKSSNVKPLLISLGLMFFQQMSGINAVIFYTSDIFEMAGSSAINKNTSTIIVGVVNFVSTFIATVLIDRLGRKILLYVSSILMILTLGILGTYFYLLETGVEVSSYGWLPLASFVIYVLGFSLGFGPIPWLMMGEILPAKIRGSAASVATAFNWSCTFIVTKTFVDIIHSIGPHGTFWMFSVICVISLVFVIICVPETQGQSLEEIERKLAGVKVRRMSSAANLKPLPSTF